MVLGAPTLPSALPPPLAAAAAAAVAAAIQHLAKRPKSLALMAIAVFLKPRPTSPFQTLRKLLLPDATTVEECCALFGVPLVYLCNFIPMPHERLGALLCFAKEEGTLFFSG